MCAVPASSQRNFRRTAIHSVPPSFSEGPDILGDSVHLDEDSGKSGWELKPLACVGMLVCGMLSADDATIVPKSTEGTCEDDRHCDLFRITRPHHARNGNGDNDAPHIQQGSPGPTTRCRSGGPEVYMQTMHFWYLGAVLSTQVPT